MPTTADRLARRAVLVGFAIQGFTFASLATRLPEIKDEFGLSDYDILLLLAAVAVASGVGSVLAGNRQMFVVPLVAIPLLPLMAGRFATRTPARAWYAWYRDKVAGR